MNPVPRLPLPPLSYHVGLAAYLQRQEADIWKWFSADRLRAEQSESVRLELLKSTYRIERERGPALYAAGDEVATKLGLDAPLTFYQSQSGSGLNASLAYIPGEAHLILQGSVTDRLTPAELRCVLGHELAHFLLFERWQDYLVASQILAAMTRDPSANGSHLASARLFGLYSEVYCDRGAYLAGGDLAAAVCALVKIETGITEVSAESYLRQADEIFGKGHPRTEGITHPETFIRARAMKLWVEEPERAAAELQRVIEGPVSVAELDLLGQQTIANLTRRLVASFLRPRWLHTEPLLAHARLFFDDFHPADTEDPALAAELKDGAEGTRDYFCYVLLDFAAADRELEDAPLAAALLLSDELGLGARFRQLAAKELNLRQKALEKLEADASGIVAKAREDDAQA
jgi:hypothetical protein